MKLAQGADGAAVDVSSAAPLQVSLANHSANATAVKVDGSAVTQPVSGTITADLGATDNAVLDAIEVDTTATVAALGTTADAAATAGSTGSLSAKQRLMTSQLDSIKTAVETIDNAIAGTEMQVDIVAALPAGTNAIGKLAANTGVNIGDVDVTSIIPGTAATNLGKARDSAIGATDTGVAILGVRRDTPTAETPAAGDYVVPQYSANGEAWVRLAGELADDAAFTPGTTRVVPIAFQADETATDSVDEGDAGAARMTLDRKQIVTPQPHTAGGLSIFRSLDLDETEEDVKTAAGQVYSMWVTNTATTTRYVKFYNATAANVTVGTTTPVITIAIPGNTSDDITGNFNAGGFGIAFGTAISVAATTGAADNDTGAPAAGDVICNIFYA